MYIFSKKQQQKALLYLVIAHIVIIATSNYLVQIPFSILGMHNTWGAFTFPLIFLTTDLTVRIFGAPLARKIIFCVTIPALLISYFISVIFADGILQDLTSLTQFNSVVFRISLASFLGYASGQILDISVFNKLRQSSFWWAAPMASTIIGSAIDSLIFFSVAFYSSADQFMAQHWLQIAFFDYLSKLIIALILFLPAYKILLDKITAYLTKIKTPLAINYN